MRIHYAYGRSLADLEEADGGAAGDAVLTEKEGAAGHRSPLLLARLRSGALDADAIAHEVVPDLVRHCPVWQAADEELRRLRREVRHWDEVIVAMEGADAPALWARLGGLSQDAQLRAVDEDENYHHWGLCRLLLAAGLEEAAAGRAARAARLALLAVRISRHLGEGYDPAWVADLTAIGLARLGMARRLLGEPHSAGQAFAAAGTWCARGTGDPQVEAQRLAEPPGVELPHRAAAPGRIAPDLHLPPGAGGAVRPRRQPGMSRKTIIGVVGSQGVTCVGDRVDHRFRPRRSPPVILLTTWSRRKVSPDAATHTGVSVASP